MLNCVRILEYAPTVFTANCAIPAFDEGNDIALPADKHSISIRQPLPKPFFSPITKESGINTSLPLVGPFGHWTVRGMCRSPMLTPGCFAGIKAQVMPRSVFGPSKLSGSKARKARPRTVQIGASVM